MRSGLWAGKNSPEPHVCLWFWLLSCLNPSCLVTAHTGLEPSRGHLLTPEKVSVGAGDSDTCEPHSLVHQRRQTGEQICPAHSTHTQWGGARWRGRVKGSRGGTREWGCKSENPPPTASTSLHGSNSGANPKTHRSAFWVSMGGPGGALHSAPQQQEVTRPTSSSQSLPESYPQLHQHGRHFPLSEQKGVKFSGCSLRKRSCVCA